MTFLIEDAAPEDFQAALTFVDEYESSSSEFSEELLLPTAPVNNTSALALNGGGHRSLSSFGYSNSNRSRKQDGPDVGEIEDDLISLGDLDIIEIASFVDESQSSSYSTSSPAPSSSSSAIESPLKAFLPIQPRQYRSVSVAAKKVPALTKNGKKPITWDPNKARNERKAELMYLRKQVMDLQNQLNSVKTKKPRISSQIHPTLPSSHEIIPTITKPQQPSNPAVVNVWKALADRQRDMRVKSERENIRLKMVLEGQIKIAKSLEEMLNKKTSTKKIEESVNGKPLTHIYPPTADRTDSTTFEELLAGVEEAYSEIDAVFEANGLAKSEIHSDAKMRLNGSNGIYLEVFAGKVLPFSLHSTSNAVWNHFANPKELRQFRRYYNEKSQTADVTADTLVENFNMVLHANRTSAIFRVKRIIRRYIEEERIVVVWWAFIDPIELSDEPLSGVRFLEKGYILIKKPTSVSGNFSLLQSCYITTPVFTGEWTQDDHPQVGAITDFVLSSTESNISASHQMIEDVLLQQAMKTSGL